MSNNMNDVGRLNIIGAGKLGQTVGRLWTNSGVLSIGDILNRSHDSTQRAVDFIGAGRVIKNFEEMRAAEYYLLACPDDQIETCCQQLVDSGVINTGVVVFHCSGALNSTLLHSAKEQGAHVASVHPVRSFAHPGLAIEQFPGTYCGMEGHDEALHKLSIIFTALGAVPFAIKPEKKMLYHAASVMACNYLVTLQEISLQALEEAGIQRCLGAEILQPLVEGTVKNVFEVGTADALTGPVARGDAWLVEKQLKAVAEWNHEAGELYRMMGLSAVDLAGQKSRVLAPQFDAVLKVLSNK
ncbi:MAG: Rossmann-like and DUF2520 domain-containing protein [Thiolinea sp.]